MEATIEIRPATRETSESCFKLSLFIFVFIFNIFKCQDRPYVLRWMHGVSIYRLIYFA